MERHEQSGNSGLPCLVLFFFGQNSLLPSPLNPFNTHHSPIYSSNVYGDLVAYNTRVLNGTHEMRLEKLQCCVLKH